MKKNQNIVRNVEAIVLSFSFVFILVLCFIASGGFGSSFAIDTGISSPQLPTTTFTTNYSSTSLSNYVSQALASSSTYANYTNNFDAVANLALNDNSKPLYSLMKNLEYPKTTEQIEILADNPQNVTNKAIMYIINHGYNSTNTTNTVFSEGKYGSVTDNNVKGYITQIALWLYLYENKATNTNYCIDTGSGINACDFVQNGTTTLMSATNVRAMITAAGQVSGYNYLNYIIQLVDEAESYIGQTTSTIASISLTKNYTIDESNHILSTDTITPSVSSNKTNFMYYALKIEDPNQYGAYLSDSNGNKLENTSQFNGSFKVYVPLKDDISEMDLSSITIKVYGYFVKDEVFQYRVTNTSVESNSSDNLMNKYNDAKYQKYANVLLATTSYEIVDTFFSLVNFTKISKVDITNDEELPGATLVITNKNDTTKTETWQSSDKPHYTYLDDGDYSLCETAAPDGFELKTECVDFTVTNEKITTIKMENSPLDIPDTGSFQSRILYYIGFMLIIIGLGSFIIIYNKKVQKNKVL